MPFPLRFPDSQLLRRLTGRLWLTWVVAGGSAALGIAGGQSLADIALGQRSVVEVYASIDRGAVFRLYYNNTWSEPQATSIQPGKWAAYRFPVPSRLLALRLDPSDAIGAETLVKSVSIRSGQITKSVTSNELQHWLRSGLDVTFDPEVQATRITNRDRVAYIMGSVDIDLTRNAIPGLSHFRLDAVSLLWSGILAGTILLILSVRSSDAPIALGMASIMAAALALVWYTAPLLLGWPGPPDDVRLTVGHESFFGQSKVAEIRAMNLAVVFGALLTTLLGYLLRRKVAGDVSLPPRQSGRLLLVSDVVILAWGVLLFAVGAIPAAADLHRLALSSRHAVDFDSQSVLAWQYLYAHGSLPWRDYWFPYGGGYDLLAPLYPDVTLRWGHAVLLFSVLLTAGFFVTGRSKLAVFALSGIWLYLGAMGIMVFSASPRYFLCVSLVVLAAVALHHRAMWLSSGVGIWAAYVVQEEVSQFVFAMPGVALMAGAALWSTSSELRRALLRQLLAAAGGFGVGLAMFLLSLVRHGQFEQWWEFVSTMGVMSNYSGWPADVAGWFSMPDTLDQFLMFLTVVLLTGGLLQAIWTRFRDVFLMVPAALGCVCVMLLQKQVIRPGTEAQILAIPVLGLALLVIQQVRLRPFRYRYMAWTTFSACLIVSCFTLSVASNRDQVWSYVDVASGAMRDVRYTFLAADEWQPARNAYFTPATGTFSPMSRDEFAAGVSRIAGLEVNDNIFVLGDSSDLYVALRRPLPFYVSLYNQSPLFSQRKTIAWLQERDPKYLFWCPQEKEFDGVPNPVRTPLLYGHAVARFVPSGTLGKFEVLRRRRTGEPPAIAYWRDKLGASLDLGYIPATSLALSEANDRGPYRARYLIVGVAAPEEGKVYTVSLRLAGEEYAVRFNGRKHVTEYAVALDRLPFAEAGDSIGRPPEVESPREAGVTARISTLRFSKERLY